MTGVEMQTKVERVSGTLSIPQEKLLSAYTYSYLNDAQDLFIKETFEKQFEKAQPELDDLRTLMVVDHEVANLTEDTAAKLWEGDLPDNYRHLIADSTKTVYCSSTDTYANRLIRSEFLREVLTFTYSKTAFDSPVSNIHGAKIRVYYSDFVISTVYIDYIKIPLEISVSQACELPESVHPEIVKKAINSLIEIYDPQRLQGKLITDQVNEQVT
ncbi:hypothetical protein LCGC14_0245380 [marine sediment metagenome]|uniref:Uncharacterized protein n=1 Tax=marine sediment metagenome TaxID=412755 RepID=A0A0F9UMA9_9ZZZZ